ncbi:UDP-N-acetylglucosamine-peptide N-acetylglucosaminyltransferase [Methyloferula stellata]|uniref:O-linked N-acetylglucosamine transferase, SPINDLY family protein n=1 Tax=Methyloferula stellata TaxID=876270 RepID=UPI00126911D2|nr:UDP-N-acetylglucosamine-peptide N-acetylglucosaminyltransferase [Methyloferula stellata]
MKALHRARAMCEWADFAKAAPRMRALLKDIAGQLPPFMFLSEPGVTSKEQRTCSELWMQDRHAASVAERDALAFDFDLAPRDKIRIAYLSNDFQTHATSMLLIEMFEAHDRTRFEPHAFSFGGDDTSKMRRRLEDTFHTFHDVSALSDIETAHAIHDAGIDILIDLKGYTAGARTNVMMLHPAPVQVNYLGYPGTLGGDICDYIITDSYVTPIATAADYSESFAYMPHSYQPHGRTGEIGNKPTRAEVGLPETGFVFCCFNQAFKITPPVFDLWCRLLEETPGSVLWLLHAKHAEGNLRAEAFARGIGAERLIFAPDMGQTAHLGRLQLADLVLDTAPYGAHTTASDALWAGVPVVTCAGDTFPSRVAGSLLHAVGLSELIAANTEDYVTIASVLAHEPERLAKLKARLGGTRLTAPLFDVAAYTRAIEDLYETMWRRRQLGVGHGHRAIWASTS